MDLKDIRKSAHFIRMFEVQQIKELYDAVYSSVIASFSVATLIFYLFSNEIKAAPGASFWIYLVWGITLLRGIDGYLYTTGKYKKTNVKTHLLRITTFTTLGGIGWGLIVWNYFHILTLEHQVYLLLIMVGATAFSTTTLSYSLIIVIPFMLSVLLPFEYMLVAENTTFHSGLALLMLFYLLFQVAGTIRINKKYLEKIRSQVEFKIKEKEYKNLQHAIDQHGIHSITDVQGKIVYANKQLVNVSQFSKEELLNNNYRIMRSSEHSPAFWKEMWEAIVAGNVWRHKIKNKAKDGSYFWLDTTIVPFLNSEGYPYQYIAISTDITKLKVLEQQSNNERNDALTRAKVSQLLQRQKSLKERMGEVLELISQRIDIVDKNNTQMGVFLISEKTGNLRLYLSQGHYQSRSGIQNTCIKKLVSLCRKAVISAEVYVLNNCYEQDTQISPANTSSGQGYCLVPLIQHDTILGVLFLATAPYPNLSETRLNTLRYIGNLLAMAVVNEQVRINLEKGRQYAEDIAKTKSDFLANMSHEIRTPMNGVLGMLGLLQDMSLDQKAHAYVETAHGSANMLLNVINDILDISKIESGKLHIEAINFNLRKALEDTTDLLSNLALQNKIELLCYIPPDTKTYVKGDMLRLQQVINNLLSNAIKFTHQGEVSLTVSTLKETVDHCVLRFEIKDTGIGIPEEKQDILFQAFTQADTSTSREYGGTGLGLTISKSLIEMMGGEIGFTSEVGVGSTFWFELTFEALTQAETVTHSLDKLRVLVIDDNKTNCLILDNYLQAQGVHCIVTTTTHEGLSLLQKSTYNKQPFDVLLLDFQLPDENGDKIAEIIRQNPLYADLKIILLSSIGLDTSMDPQGYYDLMLNKPVRQSFLYDAITTVMQRTTTHKEQKNDKQMPAETLSGNILLVDDSRVNLYVGKETLTKLGLNFDIATNGKEAVSARKKQHYDVILMDCQMPVMDGFEATRCIREYENATQQHPTPIIALTANAMQGDHDKCVEAGMSDYLSKPYSLRTLSDMLVKYLPEQSALDREIRLPEEIC